jgi:hypothetical protein
VHLAVIGHTEVALNGDTIYLNVVTRANDDLVTFIGRFADALHGSTVVSVLRWPVTAHAVHHRLKVSGLNKLAFLHSRITSFFASVQAQRF